MNRMTLILTAMVIVALSSCAPPIPPDIANKSVPELIELLEHPAGAKRAQAALALGMKGSAAKPAIPALIKLFEDDKAYVRNRAMEALQKIGKQAVPDLVEAVEESRSRAVRFYAAHTLKKIATPQAQQAYQAWWKKEGKAFGQ